MRSLKFRAWDASEKEMLCHGAVINDPDGWFAYLCDGNDLEGDCLMQFTGLHDKNGKEIWEGDVIKRDNELVAKVVYDPQKAAFAFAYTDGMASIIGESIRWSSGIGSHADGEVLGNIHENPELLHER